MFEEFGFHGHPVGALRTMGITKVYAYGKTYAEARAKLTARFAFKPGHECFGIEEAAETGRVGRAGKEFAFYVEGLTECACCGGKLPRLLGEVGALHV